jgi:hypothetical protein
MNTVLAAFMSCLYFYILHIRPPIYEYVSPLSVLLFCILSISNLKGMNVGIAFIVHFLVLVFVIVVLDM